MKIKYNKKNPVEKKKLIAAVCEITGAASKYMGPPTMRYQIGELIVDRDGNLVVADGEDVTALLEALRERGYEGEVEMTVQVSGGQIAASAPALCGNTGFTISLPKSKLPADAMEKMDTLLDAKGKLILKALDASTLKIEVDEEKVSFPWFDRIPEADQVDAYTKFVTALCKMVREQKRISAKEKPNENEKYAFRCFLLRLGFIGDEFKKDRKILLKNFDGSSAFRTQESADKHREKQEAKKAEMNSSEVNAECLE